MSEKSLAYHLGLYISSALLIVFAIFIFWVLRFHAANNLKNTENKAVFLSNDIYRTVRDKVVLTEGLASDIARQIEFYRVHGEARNYFTSLLNDTRYLQAIQVKLHLHDNISDNSVFSVLRSENGINYSEGNNTTGYFINEDTLICYFPDLSRKGWSEPFRISKSGDVVSIFNYPFVFRNSKGSILSNGLVECMISFGSLQDLISETKIWQHGYAFLVSDKGTFITYPLKEEVLKRNLFRLPPGDIRGDSVKIASFMTGKSGPIVVFPPALNHVKALAFSNRIPENNWLLVTAIPISDLRQSLYAQIFKMGSILLFLIGLIFFLVIAITNKVMKPLSRVSKELQNFGIEKLDQSPEARNETITIRESLIRLQEMYDKYKINQAESSIRSARFRADLQSASEIQQSIIPPAGNHSIKDTRVVIYSVFKPAQIVSGDLYDFYLIDDHRLLITIGDVSGGGIPAALFMGVAHTLIKSNALRGEAREIVSQVNKILCKNNKNQFFLTMFLGILDTGNGILNYCNAGHVPTFLISPSGNVKELGDPHGLPLGLYAETMYRDSSVHLKYGDHLILYTDGITEQVSEKGEYFGVDNFYRLFDQFKDRTPEEIAGIIVRSVSDFAGNAAHTNDLSLLVMEYG